MSITEVKDDIVIVEDVFNEQEYDFLDSKINKKNFEFRYTDTCSDIPILDSDKDNYDRTPSYFNYLLGGEFTPITLLTEYSILSFLSKCDGSIFDCDFVMDARYMMVTKQGQKVEPEKIVEHHNQNKETKNKTGIYFPYSSDANIIIYDAKFNEDDGFDKGLKETKIIKKIKSNENSAVIFDSKYFYSIETKGNDSVECLIFNYGSEPKEDNWEEDMKEYNIDYVSV